MHYSFVMLWASNTIRYDTMVAWWHGTMTAWHHGWMAALQHDGSGQRTADDIRMHADRYTRWATAYYRHRAQGDQGRASLYWQLGANHGARVR